MTGKRVTITLDRDGYTGALQLSINELDDNGSGHGYRIFGPKYIGMSKTVKECVLTERDASEIRGYLDAIPSGGVS